MVALTVQIFRDNDLVSQAEFSSDEQNTVKIGRMASAQLRLQDPRVSRIHAVIEFSAGEISVIDMGSSVGTLVNGEKVHRQPLQHGDEVVLGDTRLVIGLDGPAKTDAGEPVGVASSGIAGAAAVSADAPTQIEKLSEIGTLADQLDEATPDVAPTQVVQQTMPDATQVTPMMADFPQGDASAPAPVTAMNPQSLGSDHSADAFAHAASFAGEPAAGSQITGDEENLLPAALRGADSTGAVPYYAAAVESRPHPSLPPEEKLAESTRFLEVRLYWGEVLLRVDHYHKPEQITLGEVNGTDFFISSEDLPEEVFPLVRYQGDEYVLTFCEGMDGEVEIEGASRDFDQLRASSLATRDGHYNGSFQVRLPVSARALVHWGGATFAMRFVPPPAAVMTAAINSRPPADLPYWNSLIGSTVAHLILLLLMLFQGASYDVLELDLSEPQFAQFIAPAEEKRDSEMVKKIRQAQKKSNKNLKKQATADSGGSAPKRPDNVANKSLGGANRSADAQKKFDSFFSGGASGGAGTQGGAGGITTGDLANVIGTTSADGLGAMAGFGAKGLTQTGGGFGQTMGVAGPGTSGLGGLGGGGGLGWSGAGGLGRGGFGGGPGGPGMGGGGDNRDGFGFGNVTVKGALPREEILRVIKKNLGAVRYCYEVELQKDQSIGGRLLMQWRIAATGRVSTVSVQSNQVGSKSVGRCVQAKIKEWVFPQPTGGGVVDVVYPFVLRST